MKIFRIVIAWCFRSTAWNDRKYDGTSDVEDYYRPSGNLESANTCGYTELEISDLRFLTQNVKYQ
jgi:hypothetical protein